MNHVRNAFTVMLLLMLSPVLIPTAIVAGIGWLGGSLLKRCGLGGEPGFHHS